MIELYQFIFKICGYFCHQMPSRSFFIAGYQFPLCYRCTGLLIGTIVFIGLVSFYKLPKLRLALLLVTPMFVEWIMQCMGWWYGINEVRFINGIGFGVGMPALTFAIIKFFSIDKKNIAKEILKICL